jgi:hypothetical protein
VDERCSSSSQQRNRCPDPEGVLIRAEGTLCAIDADRGEHHRAHHGTQLCHQLLHRARHAEIALGDGVGRQRGHRRGRDPEARTGERERDDHEPQTGVRTHQRPTHHRADDPERSDHSGRSFTDPDGDQTGQRGDQRKRQRTGDHQQTRRRRRQRETLLEHLGRQDEATHVGEVAQRLAEHREGDVAGAEPIEPDERVAHPGLDADERHEAHDADGEGAEHGRARPSPLGPLAHAGEQCGGAEPEGERSEHVEPHSVQAIGAGEQPQGDHHADQAQRRLHREDRSPTDRLHERPSGHDTEDRCAGHHEAPVPERLHPDLGLEQAVDVGHRRRSARRSRRCREDPKRDHRRRTPCDGGERGEDTREQQPDDEHPLVTPQVTGLAERRSDHPEREHRTGDRPVEHAHRRPEIVGDALERHHEDRDREAHGEQAAEDHPEHGPAPIDPHLCGDAPAKQDRPRHHAEFIDPRRIERQGAIGSRMHVLPVAPTGGRRDLRGVTSRGRPRRRRLVSARHEPPSLRRGERAARARRSVRRRSTWHRDRRPGPAPNSRSS